ncbi:N-6 DNA methylase [Streptantibioticus silvisoli]|uniref:N-6 DNA methylase n=1 Tax=Streptantibioticus silvisoli TaxID=2705255 RepID=A0ABT6W4J5_9ACTN|nr:N-6 DNA methylase [Streptantibioticus silvisoli]MDI5965669.1 N-6 DNA methylase [Streptantibioticus silvisoli]
MNGTMNLADRVWRALTPFRRGRNSVDDLTSVLTLLVLARFVATDEQAGDSLSRRWARAVAEAGSGHPPVSDLEVMLNSAREHDGYPEPELFRLGLSSAGATADDLPWLADVLVALQDWPAPAEADLAEVCESLIERHARDTRSGDSGEFHTPRAVALLLAALADPQPGDRILDPACGTGEVLAAVVPCLEERGVVDGATVEAVTLNPGNERLARMNLALHGVERPAVGRARPAGPFGQPGDGLVDCVVSNPPFHLRVPETGGRVSRKTGREAGHSVHFAWLQMALDRLSNGGTAAMITAPAAAWSPHGREMDKRRQMVEGGNVLCVVALPGHLFFPQTSVPVHVWVLARDKTRQLPAGQTKRILLVDASDLGIQLPRRERVLTANDVERISRRFAEWRRAPGTTPDEPGFSRSVTHEDVIKHGYSLDPRRYVTSVPNRPNAALGLFGLLDALDQHERARSVSGSGLRDALDACRRSVDGKAQAPRVPLGQFVTGEAADANSLLLAGPSGSLVRAGDYVEQGGVPVVMPKDLTAAGFDERGMKRLDERRADVLRRFRLRVGDVVLARRGQLGRCAVVRTEQKGWICGTGCFILRPPTGLDPDYLAAYLRSGEARAWLDAHSTGITTMRTISAAVLKDLPVPWPEPGPQHALAEVMERVADYQRQLHEELTLLERVRQDALAALLMGGA